MKLWLLTANEELPKDDNPWEPWWDKTFGFVVRAETEEDAREIAAENGSDEVRDSGKQSWLEPKYSTCIELTASGEQGVILEDHRLA